MGLISKLEDKLSGNKSEQQQYDDDRTNTTGTGLTSSNTTTGSSRQHPISSGREGSGITGGTAVDNNSYGQQTSSIPGSFPGSNTTGSNTGYSNVQTSRIPDRTRDEYKTNNPEEEKLLRNIPGYAAATGNHPGTNTSTGATTHHTTTSTHPTSAIGSSTDHNTPRQPYDPYSSKGQQIAANAANNNTTSSNTFGSSNTSSGRDYNDSSVPRTQHGGISNQTTDLKENRDAVPVAGGQKIGTGAAYDSPSQGVGPGEAQQHHYGRDAAVAGTAGAAGYGASSHGRQDETSSSTAGPHKSNLLNKLDPRVDSDNSKAYDNQTSGTTGYGNQTTGTTGSTTHPSSTTGYGNQSSTTGYGNQTSGTTTQDHHYGRDAALAGGAGTAAYGASSHGNQHDSRTHQTDTSSSTAGPHKSDMLNKLDPRVDSDNSKAYSSQQGTTGYGNQTGSTSTSGYGSHPSTTTTGTQDQHHYGRDAALVGGAGALGAGAAHNHNSRNNNQDISYMKGTSADQPLSQSRDFNDRHNTTTGTGTTGYGNQTSSNTSTAGPHKSDMLNKLDPRVDSDNSKSTSGYGNTSSGNEYSEAGALTGSHGRHQYSGGNQSATTTGGETKAGWDAAKRLGGAYGAGYEAGYRDALAHAEADRLAGR